MGGSTTEFDSPATVADYTALAAAPAELPILSSLPSTLSTKATNLSEAFAQRAAARRAELEKLKADLQALTEKHGLKYQHKNPAEGHRGCTVAYRVTKKDVVEFAFANCGPLDTFTRWQGSAEAAKAFDTGRYTQLHVPHQARGALDLFFKNWMEEMSWSARHAASGAHFRKMKVSKKAQAPAPVTSQPNTPTEAVQPAA